jgi:hypothetical protein
VDGLAISLAQEEEGQRRNDLREGAKMAVLIIIPAVLVILYELLIVPLLKKKRPGRCGCAMLGGAGEEARAQAMAGEGAGIEAQALGVAFDDPGRTLRRQPSADATTQGDGAEHGTLLVSAATCAPVIEAAAEPVAAAAARSRHQADGFLRSLSYRATAWFGDTQLPLIGIVSMDTITVDVSCLPADALQPDSLIDLMNERSTVDTLAQEAGTIGYEILTSLGGRYFRRYVSG